MLTAETHTNKDFDLNNLTLNLDFQNHEEKFVYKYPLIEHPSNYQVVVSKFFSKTTMPIMRLHESKANLMQRITQPFFYDYMVRIEFSDKDAVKYFINSRLGDIYLKEETRRDFYITQLVGNMANVGFVAGRDYIVENGVIKDTRRLWYPALDKGKIYSVQKMLELINFSFYMLLTSFWEKVDNDSVYKAYKDTIGTNICLMYYIDNGRLCLKVLDSFLLMINNLNYTNADFVLCQRETNIYVSKNLAHYLRSLCLEETNNPMFMKISFNITAGFIQKSVIETDVTTGKNLYYKIYVGDEVKPMEWSDYIGIAVTSPDFPIKDQIYPHFNYDFDKDFFSVNRRHYVPKSESNISKILIGATSNVEVATDYFRDENINEQTKENRRERILFLKYFNKDDDMNYINYENNDINTTLKMDLVNTQPLKEFTLKLFLIDKYNNFVPMKPERKEFEDVVKMQLMFKRIKGEEKENRYMVEAKSSPQKVIVSFANEDGEDEEEDYIKTGPMVEDGVARPMVGHGIGGEEEEEEEEEDDDETLGPPEKKLYKGEELK